MTLFRIQTWTVIATIDQDAAEGFELTDITRLLEDAAGSTFVPRAVHSIRVELGPSTVTIGDES